MCVYACVYVCMCVCLNGVRVRACVGKGHSLFVHASSSDGTTERFDVLMRRVIAALQ